MKNRWNIPGRALCTVLLGTFFAALVATASPSAAQTGPSAAQSAATCNTTTGAISTLFLVDESTSLALTDPASHRSEGVRDALGTLYDAAATQGRDVEISIAGFGVDYQAVLPWTTLTEESLPTAFAAADQFANRQAAIDTDYMVALSGAQADHADRAGTGRCQSIVIVTDGGYAIDTRTEANGAAFGLTKTYAPGVRLDELGRSSEAVDQGMDQLCRAGGVVDQLRTADVSINTMALDAALRGDDAEFISSLSSGSTTQPCGAEPANGMTVIAANADDLRTAIAGSVASVAGASSVAGDTVAVCQLLPCTQGTVVLSIQPGTGRFIVTAGFDSPAKRLILTDPDGVSITIEPGADRDQVVGDAIVNATFDDSSAIVSAVAESAVLSDGLWTATMIDSAGTGLGVEATATVSTSQYAAANIALSPVGPAVAGEPFSVVINLVDARGNPLSAEVVEASSVSASITDTASDVVTELTISPSGDGFQATATMPDDFTGDGTLAVTASSTIENTVIESSVDHAVSATTAAVPDAPTAGAVPAGQATDGSNGLRKTLPLALAFACLAIIGVAVMWARANRRSLFDLDDVRVAEMAVALRASGQVDRIEQDETARQLYIRGNDFAAVGRGHTRTFSGGRLRFTGHMSLKPKAPTYGVAVGTDSVVGPLGSEEVDGKVGGIVSTNLEGQWLFELNESRTAFANQSGSPTAGDLYGRLVVFVHGSLDETSPQFSDLADDLVVRGRELATARREATGVDIAFGATETATPADSELESV